MSRASQQRFYSPPPYRGKTHARRRVPRFVPVALLILLVIAVILGLIASHLQQYMVYTAEGGTMVLPSDVSSSAPTASEPAPLLAGLDVAEETAAPAISAVDASRLRAVPISIDALIAGDAADLLSRSEGNALVVEMKDVSGTLYWNTALRYPGAEDDEPEEYEEPIPDISVSGRADAVEAALRACREADIYLIAEIHVFRDDALSSGTRRVNNLRVHEIDEDGDPRNYPYRDGDGHYWLNPVIPNLQEYYSNLAKELAALGFDELLLTDFCYPADWSDEDADRPEALTRFLSGFATELRDAAPTLRIDVEVEADALSQGQNRSTGQTISGFSSASDRFWCWTPPADSVPPFDEDQLASGVLVIGVDAFQGGLLSPAQALSTN
ncbi:MAG: hypothetical protein IJ751_04935 [Oscillospiraceae bacterium]|nr:hypothetical protein [Oscillospiraceae bacterium]